MIVTTLSEFYSQKYRTPMVMFVGFSNIISNICFPGDSIKLCIFWILNTLQFIMHFLFSVIAMVVIPLDFALPLDYGESYYFKSWRLYLLLTLSAPAIFGVVLNLCTFESPKYLLTNISQKEALKVMKKVYSWNTGKEEDSYPVSSLQV